jgi:phage shock protein PspC (stress-responsive transcriptional regulator)
MTEATFTSPRLERPHEAPLGGVCLALARTTGTEPVLWRVLFVVLTVFGGMGVALYLGACCVIPREDQQFSLLERLLHGPDRRITSTQVLLLAAVVLATFLAVHDNALLVFVFGAAALGYTWWRRRHPSPVPGLLSSGPAAPTATAGTATAGAPTDAPEAQPGQGPLAMTAVLPPYQAPAWTPPPPKPRSVITPLTLSVGALVVGVLLAVAAGGAASIPTEVVVAVALGVVGLGLVASAFFGRARGLVPVAILLALGLGATCAARPALDHGIGERTWSATTTGSYRLGIGHGTVTLPSAAPDGGRVEARVSLGQLTVLVPEGLHVIVNADVTNGDIEGFDVNENGRHSSHTFDLGPKASPALVVDAHVGAGLLEVRRG